MSVEPCRRSLAANSRLAGRPQRLSLPSFSFWWVAQASFRHWLPPRDALEIHVVAKQWMWKTQHPNGASEINELHAPIDTPVRLVMASQDVIHSFFVPAFRMKKDVVPGRYTETWFTATKLGVFHLFCAEYCGTDHSRMTGRIVIMSKEDIRSLAFGAAAGRQSGQRGRRHFRGARLFRLPRRFLQVHAPKLRGIYGVLCSLRMGTRHRRRCLSA